MEWSKNPIELARQLDDSTGKEWREWELETLRDHCETDDDVAMLDLIAAVQVVLTNPDVFEGWSLFHHVVTAFNHRRANFQHFDAPSTLELAWAVTAIKALSQSDFGVEIRRYIGAMCLNEGLVYFPWIDLNLATEKWANVDEVELAADVKKHWDSGALKDLEPSEVDDKDKLHVQLAKIVAAQAYVRANMSQIRG